MLEERIDSFLVEVFPARLGSDEKDESFNYIKLVNVLNYFRVEKGYGNFKVKLHHIDSSYKGLDNVLTAYSPRFFKEDNDAMHFKVFIGKQRYGSDVQRFDENLHYLDNTRSAPYILSEFGKPSKPKKGELEEDQQVREKFVLQDGCVSIYKPNLRKKIDVNKNVLLSLKHTDYSLKHGEFMVTDHTLGKYEIKSIKVYEPNSRIILNISKVPGSSAF